MKKNGGKIRIKDIAQLAGVSEGTVDRVLHNRGEVSEKSREAVQKVLKEIDYSPNLLARSLALKKQYKFICFIPKHLSGDYWHSVDEGFNLATQEFRNFNVEIIKKYFDQFDINSFVHVSKEILAETPDAVFIAPIFREETIKLTDELKNRRIHFSFIDSMIEEADFITYYGQHSFQSGYIAAKLILNSLPDEHAAVLVIRTQRKGSVSNQTLHRYNGFMQYIEDNGLKDTIELVNIELKDDDENTNFTLLSNVLSAHANIKAAITFNSKVYRLVKHLENLNQKHIQLVGYDLLEKNVDYLQKGVIAYLIAQRPEKQAYFTVQDMCRELIFHQETKKINYMPIDVLMKENIAYYVDLKD